MHMRYITECRANVFHLSQHLQLSVVSQNDHSFILDLSRWHHNELGCGSDFEDKHRGSLIVVKPTIFTK